MPTNNPFPLPFVPKVNSPELVAFLQQFGAQLYADANDINNIFQALNYLYEHTDEGVQLLQDNFVRKLTIYTSSLSGTGTIQQQVCEYILALPEEDRTILDTDSAWIIELIEGSIPTGRKHNSKFNSKFN